MWKQKTSFLSIIELSDGKATGYYHHCRLVKLDFSTKVYALSSDGASVRLGR